MIELDARRILKLRVIPKRLDELLGCRRAGLRDFAGLRLGLVDPVMVHGRGSLLNFISSFLE